MLMVPRLVPQPVCMQALRAAKHARFKAFLTAQGTRLEGNRALGLVTAPAGGHTIFPVYP